jgi:capsular polysaccharide biosynthesis protein
LYGPRLSSSGNDSEAIGVDQMSPEKEEQQANHKRIQSIPTGLDPDDYLQNNPDVHERRLDPIVHWMMSGRNEDRKWNWHIVRIFGQRGYQPDATKILNKKLAEHKTAHAYRRFSYGPEEYKNARIVPQKSTSQHFLAYDNKGRAILDSVLHPGQKDTRHLCVRSDFRNSVGKLPGRYLLVGPFFRHFGHFFFESVSRLWAYPKYENGIDGIIFTSEPHERIARGSIHREILDYFRIRKNVVLLTDEVEVEQLIVPRPGLGLDEMAVGTEEFRLFVSKYRDEIKPERHEKVYVSRKLLLSEKARCQLKLNPKLFVNTGGILDEEQVEQNLAREGYFILYPELHSFSFCMSVYNGAQKIVLPEGGAIAPTAFAANTEARILVLRRGGLNATSITAPAFMHGFLGEQGVLADCTSRFFMMERARRTQTPRVYVEINHPLLARTLFEHGFIDNPEQWISSSAEKLEIEKAKIQNMFDRRLNEVSRKSVVERDGKFSFYNR